MTRLLRRGHSHDACPEVMSWCETNNISCVFDLVSTKSLSRKVDEEARTIAKIQDLAKGECKTIRLQLIKIVARVIETRSRIHIAFVDSYLIAINDILAIYARDNATSFLNFLLRGTRHCMRCGKSWPETKVWY
jgi:hypothetical protein